MQGAIGPQGALGPGYKATSATSQTIATGSKVFAVGGGLAFTALHRARVAAASSPSVNWMEGNVTSYNSGNLTLSIDLTAGAGTFASWLVSLIGDRGLAGVQGVQGDRGLTGPPGDQGFPGQGGAQGGSPSGPIGSDGAQGVRGFQGAIGAQGPQGEQGEPGPDLSGGPF
jgi:hypothetical protein